MDLYVAGYLFSVDCQEVLLIRKNRPEHFAGLLNGVGGKVEPGETPLAAMKREFNEEAAMKVFHWQEVVVVSAENYIVWFYAAYGDVRKAKIMTDEVLEIWDVGDCRPEMMVPHCYWTLALAALDIDVSLPVYVREQ